MREKALLGELCPTALGSSGGTEPEPRLGNIGDNHGLAWRLQLGDDRAQTAKAKVPAVRASEAGCNFDPCSGLPVCNGQCPCKAPSLRFSRTLLHTVLHTTPHPMLG